MNPSSILHYYLALVKIVFRVNGEIHVVERQIFEKSDINYFPARRVHMLTNSAALQLRNTLPEAEQASFEALDAFVINLTYLGAMTEEQFWQGMDSPPAQEEAPVAAAETQEADTAPVSNVHQLRPSTLASSVIQALDEPQAPSEIGPDQD